MPLCVTIWHEFRHEKKNEEVRRLYPDGMHAAIRKGIAPILGRDVTIRLAALDDAEQGLPDDVLKSTDVLIWWGHGYHGDVKDELAARVAQRVREGMGLIVLHSGHYSKPFKLLLGTNCHVKWREAAEKERLWVVAPGHPITAGLKSDGIVIDHEEMYGEHFDIPDPDELIFISWFEGGEVFRSGCVWRRGAGRIFYFRPGHESFPTYYHPEVLQVIANGVRYLTPAAGAVAYRHGSPNIVPSLESIQSDHQVDASLHETQPKF